MKTSKNKATKIMIGLALLSIFILYHTGIKAEKDCLALGHSASQCANFFD